MIKLSTPNIEQESLDEMCRVIRSGQLVHGAECNLFEAELAEYLGVEYAYVCASGTAALHLALLALDIGSGSAVIVPDFTYPATGNVVAVAGARPVVVDVDPNNYCIDLVKLREKVESWNGPEKLEAIMPVHEFGYPCDMEGILAIADEFGLRVIEDAACAIGASRSGKKMGTLGTVGCFSFHPRKTLTTGEGGLVVTNDRDTALRLRRYRNHGMERTESGMQFFFPGLNYRLTNFQAVLGRHQLPKLDGWIEKRRALAQVYLELLHEYEVKGKLRLPRSDAGHSWQTFMLVLDSRYDRDQLVTKLKTEGVETSLGAQSLTSLDIYSGTNKNNCDSLVGNELFTQGLALPFCESYHAEDAKFVVNVLSKYLV